MGAVNPGTTLQILLQNNPTERAEMEKLSRDFNKWATPLLVGVIGPSQVGKSSFILKLIKYRDLCFDSEFKRIMYIFPKIDASPMRGDYCRQLADVCPQIEFRNTLPSEAVLSSPDSMLLSRWNCAACNEGVRRDICEI